MATDVIKTIAATNSPTVPDYATLALWEADITADLVAADERHIGECLDQGTFATGCTIGGHTVDATRYVYLRCATGASFRDQAGVRTTPLCFDANNGVTITGVQGFIQMSEQRIRLEGLQVYRTAYGNSIFGNQLNCTIDSCIIRGGGTGVRALAIRFRSSVINTLIEHEASSDIACGGDADFYGCTIVNTSGSAGTSVAFENIYSQGRIKNCAVFGFSDFSSLTPETGTDYNATDLASVGTGSNNQTSLTFANQFENSANDFRAKSTGDLQAGTPDATNTPDDITGLARDATTPWIGAWEVAGGGGGATSILRQMMQYC